MNDNADINSFECPKGFTKENISSQLYYEDLDEDSELWLVRMPNDVDSSAIESREISLDGSEFLIGNDDKQYKCFSDKCEMPNLCLVLPYKDTKQLSGVNKTFKGSLFVTEYMLQNLDTGVKMEIEDSTDNSCASTKPKSTTSNSIEAHESNQSSDLNGVHNQMEEGEPLRKQSKKESKKKKSKSLDSIKKENTSDENEFPNCDSQKK